MKFKKGDYILHQAYKRNAIIFEVIGERYEGLKVKKVCPPTGGISPFERNDSVAYRNLCEKF